MMTKNKPAAWRMIKFFVLFPALVLLVFTSTKSDNGMAKAPDQDPKAEQDSTIFFDVEEMPSFQGKGQDGFRDYLTENITYPEDAKEKGIQGRVFVQFVVKANGSIGDAQVVRGVHLSLDKEALRVVKSSPDWEPGRQDGKAVNVAFTFPINFSLEQKKE